MRDDSVRRARRRDVSMSTSNERKSTQNSSRSESHTRLSGAGILSCAEKRTARTLRRGTNDTRRAALAPERWLQDAGTMGAFGASSTLASTRPLPARHGLWLRIAGPAFVRTTGVLPVLLVHTSVGADVVIAGYGSASAERRRKSRRSRSVPCPKRLAPDRARRVHVAPANGRSHCLEARTRRALVQLANASARFATRPCAFAVLHEARRRECVTSRRDSERRPAGMD